MVYATIVSSIVTWKNLPPVKLLIQKGVHILSKNPTFTYLNSETNQLDKLTNEYITGIKSMHDLVKFRQTYWKTMDPLNSYVIIYERKKRQAKFNLPPETT